MTTFMATHAVGAKTRTGHSTALMVNPASFQAARRGLANDSIELARRHGVPCRTAYTLEGFTEAVDELLAESPQILTVLGGDGTVHAVVMHLIHSGQADHAPPLLLLGGGRTNVTAASVNTAQHRLTLLEEVVAGKLSNLSVSKTPTLAVHVPGAATQYGFLLAGALVAEVIQDCHEWRTINPTRWRRSNTGTGWRLLSQMARSLAGLKPYQRPDMTVHAGSLGTLEGRMRLLLLSTLENLGPWLDPFSDRGEGELRVTAVRTDARRFWWHAPALARGRLGTYLGPEQGYLSGRTDRCELEGISHYCIDGQPISAPDGKIIVEAGPEIELIRLP
jgi:diacylglycerol kinase (ATP)